MNIRYRIAYVKDNLSKEFYSFLIENKAKFDVTNSYIGVAYIYENEKIIDRLQKFLQADNIIPIIDCVYTKDEIQKAKWLSIRSTFRFEYPQPEDAFSYKSFTYNDSEYCSGCGGGLTQIESFRIKKAPKWGERNFLMLNWIEDELFTTSKVKDIFERENILGIEFLDVINSKSNKAITDIHQLSVKSIIDQGLVDKNTSVREVKVCSKCKKEKYIYSGRGLSYKKESFEGMNYDAIKTYETFGDGHMCSRKIIISDRLYKLIKARKLDKMLEFEPVNLI